MKHSLETFTKFIIGFVPRPVKEYLKQYAVLKECPREFWLIQLINFFESAGYFAIIFTLAIYLNENLGVADDTSQKVAGTWLALISVAVFCSGSLVDALGIKKSLRIAALLNFVGRVLLASLAYLGLSNHSMFVLVIAALALQGLGYGFMQPLMSAAVRRYTSKEGSRSAGFSLWYTTMQLGAIPALFLLDILRATVGLAGVFVMAAIVNGIYLILTMFVKQEAQVGKEDEEAEADKKRNPLGIMWELFKTSHFWRFMAFMVILIGIRMTYAFAYLVMPKYYLRVLGEDALIGTLSNINPILIAVGLVVLTPVFAKFKTMTMLLVGMTIAVGSVFILALPVDTRNVFGLGIGGWYLLIIVAQIMAFAVSEMIWSPRLQEYTANVAPKGREGAYQGCSLLPTFLSKTLVGWISGYFFVNYCPETELREKIEAGLVTYWQSPEAMWFWLGLIVSTSLVLTFVFLRWIPKEAKKKEVEPATV
ncbi:MAG: MFS transporter [Candidatus Uhrbacteria bacterium]